MRKKLLSKVMLLLAMLVMGASSVWAAEEVFYTLTPAEGSNNSYAGNCDITISNITWNVTGNAQYIPWRIGGKSITKTDRTVYSKTAMGEAITKVELSLGTASSITINSITLTVASDADFSNELDEVKLTSGLSAESTLTFNPTSGTEWAKNAYYRFTFNVTVSSTSNKYVQFSEAKFYYNKNTDKQDVTLSFGETTAFTVEPGAEFTAPSLSISPAGLSVAYSSDNTAVASVNASTGAVTIGDTEGTATITASFEENATYNGASATYMITVYDSYAKGRPNNPYTVAEALDYIVNTVGSTATTEDVYVKGFISRIQSVSSNQATYFISDDGATDNELEIYRGKGLDGADVSEGDLMVNDEVVVCGKVINYNNNTPEFSANSKIVSLNRVVKAEANLTLTGASTMNNLTTQKLVASSENTESAITFESSDENVATVSTDGTVSALSAGTVTITASQEANDDYYAATATFVITITAASAVDPVGPVAQGGYFEKVTDASTLKAGDKLIIVGESNAMSATQNSNNRSAVSVAIEKDETIASVGDDVQIITLEGEAGAWYFNVGDGYLYAASSSSNYMRTEEDADDNAKAKISISEGAATITFQGTNSRNLMRYNPNISNNNPLFSCYSSNSSTGSLPTLYRFVEGTPATTFDVEIGDSEWKTLVSSVAFTMPSEVKAYIVSGTSDESATLTEIADVPANEPVLLNAAQGTYTLTVADKATADVSANKLQVSDATTGNGVYVLANKSGVGFYQWAGGQLGAGRVYLPAEAGVREFMEFSFGDATAIERVDAANGAKVAYDLSGRRVQKPVRGLYILNGKVVVIK